MNERVSTDTWLSEILGFPCLRVSVPATARGVEETLSELERQSQGARAFAYAKVPCEQVEGAAQLTRAGFYVVDVSVTFERPPEPPRPLPMGDGVQVFTGGAEEAALAREIAGECIVYSRFNADPGLSVEQGRAVNWAWIDNYCRGLRGEMVQLARLDGAIVGFNAILRGEVAGKACRVIDLIGVSPSAQRRGVGQALMGRFVADTAKQGLPMRVTTQAANIPAVNLYERNGFRLAESALVLHRHIL